MFFVFMFDNGFISVNGFELLEAVLCHYLLCTWELGKKLILTLDQVFHALG